MNAFNQTTVFIVDDDKLFTGLVKNEIVTSFGLEDIAISVFETGEECELYLHEQPDIAIIDFHMNSKYRNAMNGIAIIEKIKELSPHTEIIMFTNEEDMEVVKKAFDKGAYDYIIKNHYIFQRFNVSFRRCLNMLELKNELKMQKNRGIFAVIIIAVLLGIATTIQIFAPHLL